MLRTELAVLACSGGGALIPAGVTAFCRFDLLGGLRSWPARLSIDLNLAEIGLADQEIPAILFGDQFPFIY